MAASTSASPIIHPRDAKYLRDRGRLLGPDENGFLRIHKRPLDEAFGLHFDDSEYFDPTTAFDMIPASLVSRATLVFIGFSEPTAELLWARWLLHDHQQHPLVQPGDDDTFYFNSFLVFALGAISSSTVFSYPSTVYRVANPNDSEEHWRQTLNWYGLRTVFIEAVLDPNYGERPASDILVMRVLHRRYEHLVKLRNFSHS
ncbi:hypothetical protein PG985_014051 [Apiospora marii]|uniref:Uncharacterized protein n=1 Tax=Apiospora marii TaxID=335849 RepID=A0ABR1R6D7_9PEZI